MRDTFPAQLERARIPSGPYGSAPGMPYGAFRLRVNRGSRLIVILGSDRGWEHASVSHAKRVPDWDEMHAIKRLIWRDDETVIQLHPAESDWVNIHPNCLHLWRPTDGQIPLPPKWMV